MNKILISHEVPLCMLEDSHFYNDYGYCLVHLLPLYPEYENFFKESIEQGRKVILDNSLYELGKPVDDDFYLYWIKRLRPTEFIIPDFWENMEKTIESVKKWSRIIQDNAILDNIKCIGVLQGKNESELFECYSMIEPFVDKIGISFGYSLYEGMVKDDIYKGLPSVRKLYTKSKGRQMFVDNLINYPGLNKYKPLHLLGCSLPDEFMHYQEGYDCIDTLDTSNPVIQGIDGKLYSDRFSLLGYYTIREKSSVKVADIMELRLTTSQKASVMFNIDKFRELVKGK